MGIKFASYRKHEELEKEIGRHLQIGVATPDDIRAFAQSHQLRYSELYNKYWYQNGAAYLTSSHLEFATVPFDKFIICAAPAPKMRFWVLFAFNGQWNLYFTFSNEILAEILINAEYVAL